MNSMYNLGVVFILSISGIKLTIEPNINPKTIILNNTLLIEFLFFIYNPPLQLAARVLYHIIQISQILYIF